jgi:molybdenum cofactor guanylyltransferase
LQGGSGATAMTDGRPAPAMSGAILAGGRARRFGGRDKARLVVGGASILERQIDVLAQVTDRQVIVANDGEAYRSTGLPVVPDAWPDGGPLGGIYTALLETRSERVVVVACDMPFIRADFLGYLHDCSAAADAVVPRTPDGLHPLCAVYSRAALATIARHLSSGRMKVTDMLRSLRLREVSPDEIARFDPDGNLLFNINTSADYARAEAATIAPGGSGRDRDGFR